MRFEISFKPKAKIASVLLACSLLLMLSAFIQSPTLKGNWLYAGGIANGKAEAAPAEFTLQRKYTSKNFEAFLLEKGEKPMKYQAGNYELRADSCLETETFNIQSPALTGVTLRYQYAMRNDTLILNGKLPNGSVVQEFWVRGK